MRPVADDTRMLGCEGAIEALQDALDDRLRSIDRSPWLAAHLADCARCRARSQGLELVDRTGRHLAADLMARRIAARGRALQTWFAAAAAVYLLAGPAIVARVTRHAQPEAQRTDGNAIERALEDLAARRNLFFGSDVSGTQP
jgi:hypothetical protein